MMADWILFDAAARDAAMALNGDDVMVAPRAVDTGDWMGRFACGARLLDDPDYARWHVLCGALPVVVAEAAGLFAED